MMPSIQHIAAKLGGKVYGHEARAPGPNHGPDDMSLSVAISASGDDIVVMSFANDDPIMCKDFAREKIGLDAWRARRKANGHAAPAAAVKPAIAAPLDFSPARPNPILVAEYNYLDCDGVLLYQVQRLSDKGFRQRRPDGNGGWIKKDVFKGVTRVPYRLADLIEHAHASVFITEGEKDCDNVAALGLCATTVAGGVWTADCTEPLAGRDVFILEDHDEPGRKKSVTAALALHNIAGSIRIIPFTELQPKGDVSDWLALGNGKDALISRCTAAPAWTPTSVLPPVAKQAPVLEPLPFIDLSSWSVEQGAPGMEWGVEEKFPMRNVILLSGEGATGKSLLSMQLGVSHALGRDWLGSAARSGSFLYFSAEDDRDELQRRLTAILHSQGVDFPDIAGRAHLLEYAGQDAVLGVPDGAGLIKPTLLFERLLAAAIALQPIMICLDTSADVFAGNENDRAQARQFVGMLRKMAMQANAYVLVNSHPSLTGISSGTGTSGSTGWSNSVRARAYLTTVKTEKGEEPDTTLRRLEFKKSNYGPISSAIDLRWEHGVFKPVAVLGSLERKAVDQNAERTLLLLLDRFNSQGRNVSDRKAAKNYAPTMFGQEDDAKSRNLKKADFEQALIRLFAARKIVVQPYGVPSKNTTRLVSI